LGRAARAARGDCYEWCHPKQGKSFFFEKKKQKTFAMLSRAASAKRHEIKRFLVLFFKKEPLPVLAWTHPYDFHH